MKIHKILATVVLSAVSASSYATWGYWSSSHNCDPKDPPSGGGCIVTWDFTKNSSDLKGDPLPTYPGSDPAYSLVVEGFAIGRKKTDGGSINSYSGEVFDRPTTAAAKSGDYATDYDGSSYGIGVHAEGEGDHWGTKIDNQKNDWESMYVRDAVLLDFGNCLVSIDEIGLLKAYSGADTDFELWAYSGAIDQTKTLAQLGDYDNWTAAADLDAFQLVDQNWSTERTNELEAVINGSPVASRYFILIAGGDKLDKNDAFRIANLSVNCDPANCKPPPGGGGEAPVPGTLALLGIGALAARRRYRKLS